MIIEKQYARRSVEGYRSPYEDTFEYRPISTLSRSELLTIISEVQRGSEGRDITGEASDELLDGMIEFANTAFDPSAWLIAYLDGEIAGLVFAQRYFDKMEEGSIFLVGVTPDFRGKGFGKILHAKGLQLLSDMGVTGYVGSTDINNLSMLRIFDANDCRKTAIRKVEWDQGQPTGIVG